MFENLTSRLNQVFDQLRRRGRLSEADVDAAMREVRLALLEADVHFSVVKSFIARVRERAIGAEVSKALNPGQQIIKIVNDELIETLGEAAPLNLRGPRPHVIMLVGLQGSGKTTGAGKLARMLRSKGERVMLVAGDPYRPAAVTQLQQLVSNPRGSKPLCKLLAYLEPRVSVPQLRVNPEKVRRKSDFCLLSSGPVDDVEPTCSAPTYQ